MAREGAVIDRVVDDAIVTAVIPYGEDDLVVRLFGATVGRVGAFAAKARRSKKRFAGGLSPLARGRVELVPRRGSELYRLDSAELTLDPAGLGADVLAFGRASYLAELLEKLLPEAEPAADVFADVATALEVLSHGRGDAALLRAFELRLLLATGYLPDLAPHEEPVVGYDPGRGELLAHEAPGAVPFNDAAREAALALLSAPLTALPDVELERLRTVSRLFATHLRRMDVGPLKSIAFLKALPA